LLLRVIRKLAGGLDAESTATLYELAEAARIERLALFSVGSYARRSATVAEA
jgi:hypothetical protein